MRSSWIICVCLKSNDSVLTDDAGRDQKILGRWGARLELANPRPNRTGWSWKEQERNPPSRHPDFTLRTSTTVIGFIAGTRSHAFALGNQ